MRLIDADELMEEWDKQSSRGHYEFDQTIMEQPTAYDVDKVVKQIQKKHCGRCRNILGILGAEEYCKEQKCQIEELCEIVRNGGVK